VVEVIAEEDVSGQQTELKKFNTKKGKVRYCSAARHAAGPAAACPRPPSQ